MKSTMFRYIFKMQLKTILLVSLFMFCLIVVFDFAEVARRMSVSNFNDFRLAIKLSILGAPSTFEAVLHYIYFITITFSLWNLCQSQQMVILKSSGQSPLQILSPFIACAILVSAGWLFFLQPLGIVSDYEYKKCMNQHVEQCNTNVWIKHNENNQLIFMKKINELTVDNFYLFSMEDDTRIIADNATINDGEIILKNGTKIAGGSVSSFKEMSYPGKLNKNLLQVVSSSPKNQSIYGLYSIYSVEKENKVSLKEYEIALQKLLVNCFHYTLFVLIAAVICFPINRYRSKMDIVIRVVLSAITLRFFGNILESMAYTEMLPISLAVWGIDIIAACISIAILIWREA